MPRSAHLSIVRFITPCLPVLRDKPPTGPDWLHEAKFDGWRVQIHRRPDGVKMFSRKGFDLLPRFPSLRESLDYLRESVVDGELVACDSDGKPDFAAITNNHDNLCIWCFDLLGYRGEDVRQKPLVERREMLRELLITADDHRLRFSEEFADPVKLLQVAETMGLEGVVSKRKSAPYRSWPRADWVKVKTKAWREANADRGEMFNKKARVEA